MKDRVPEPGKENRFKFTLDDGTVLSGVLTFDDEAIQEGTPLNKENLLSDATSGEIFGENTDHTVDEALKALITKLKSHSTDYLTSGVLPKIRGGTGYSDFDTTPTSGSLKAVTSGGTYNALLNLTRIKKIVCGSASLSNEYKGIYLGGNIEAAIIIPYNYYTSNSTYSLMTPYPVYATNSSSAEQLYVSGATQSGSSSFSLYHAEIEAYKTGSYLYARYRGTNDIPGFYYIAFIAG